ncbi:propionyl-CoA synthetase, partial [Mycobacterium tuberculosis]|nr:propionyl-CoA synthetase [Mycobacterium tuberculosis]
LRGDVASPAHVDDLISGRPAVAEAAVIGVRDELKGQRPVGYVVLKSGQVRDPEELRAELVAMVREEIGAVATFRDCTVVQ